MCRPSRRVSLPCSPHYAAPWISARNQSRKLMNAGMRAGPVAAAEQDRAVQVCAMEVVTLHIGHEVQRDLRMRALEHGQARDQPLGAEGRQRRYVQRASTVGARDQLERRGLQLAE